MDATAAPSKLDTQETTGQNPAYESYRTYRRSFCAEEFLAVEQLYSTTDELDETRRSKLLAECRSTAWFVREKSTGNVHVASNSCKLRWCPICAKAKSTYIAHNVKPWIESLRTARFLTLTLKHSNAPLDTQISKLYDDFRKLRKDKQFKQYCTGGVWFFQIKLSKNDDQWHPHLHCVIAGAYIPRDWMKRKWKYVTTSSDQVDIQMVKSSGGMSNEVAKYCAKPAQLENYSMDLRKEIFYAMHGRRLCGTWGLGKSVKLCPPRAVDKDQFEDLGGWTTIVSLRDQMPEAQSIFDAWQNGTSLPPDISLRCIDDFIEDRISFLQSDIDSGKFDPTFEYQ